MSRQSNGDNILRRAKIVCTIGPASEDPDTLRRLVEAGANAVRVNMAHATRKAAATLVERARDLARGMGRPLAVLLDLQGPKIRVGDLEAPLKIERGRSYHLVPEGSDAAPEGASPESIIPTTYPELARDVGPGNQVLLADGEFQFEVVSVRDPFVEIRAESDGELKSQKGINLPGVKVHASFLTEKDREDLKFAKSCHADFVGLSFVQSARDMEEAREAIEGESLLIAKIEKDQALQELREIIQLSDGVMVARGDLGVELPYEEVPMIQKRIIRMGRVLARPVITATQMLESMTRSPRPTRAEVSDVANALLDGTDAVMLSEETAVGDYPVESVEAMASIIRRIESEAPPPRERRQRVSREERESLEQSGSAAISTAAIQAAGRLKSPVIVTLTRSGFTAKVMSSFHPPVPILAITDQWRTYNQLALHWGVHPVLFRGELSYESMRDAARKKAKELDLGKSGDRYVVTAGFPFHVPGTTNMMRIEKL